MTTSEQYWARKRAKWSTWVYCENLAKDRAIIRVLMEGAITMAVCSLSWAIMQSVLKEVLEKVPSLFDDPLVNQEVEQDVH